MGEYSLKEFEKFLDRVKLKGYLPNSVAKKV